jgi:hypothetical protein
MVGWAVLGFCLLIALLLVGRTLVNADPRNLAKIIRYGGAGLLGSVAAFFTLTGRLVLAWPFALMALAVLGVRGRSPFAGFGFPGGGFGRRPSSGQHSEISTRCLRMTLDHDTGAMSGRVLDGPHRGSELAALSFHQLTEIYRYLEQEDSEGATLLATYLARERDEEWRAWQDGDGPAGDPPPHPEGAMTTDEALKILGLELGATLAEVKSAHKRLMKKMHPDQGGSTYLASKINRAKEILLDRMRTNSSG